MASTSRTTIIDLPDEVMLCIFLYLPMADLARCAAVCERWRSIVTGFTLLWRGKRYRSFTSPAECAEARAVLRALPPLQKVITTSHSEFVLRIFYPHMKVSLKYLSSLETCQRLTCQYLEAPLENAGEILSRPRTLDFDRLLHLEIHTGVSGLPSRVLADLPRLHNLRKLSLRRCHFEESELAAAVVVLAGLEWLELDGCSPIGDLSFLQRCRGLQELRVTTTDLLTAVPEVEPATRWMGLLRLPSRAGRVDTLMVNSFKLTAASLPAALRRLEKMGMGRRCLGYLGALRSCTQLKHVCCEFARGPSEAQLYNVLVHIYLTNVTHLEELQHNILIY